jgi:hypothetical protein
MMHNSSRVAPPWRARARKWANLLLMLAAPVACEGWEEWDNAFRRRFLGWHTGDGGFMVEIPGNRLMTVFGDTYTVNAYAGTGGHGVVFGSTVAVHPIKNPANQAPTTVDDNPYDPSNEVKFFGRNTTSPNAAKEITWDASGTWRYFGRSCGDLTGHVWPAHGIAVGTSELAQFTYKMNNVDDWIVTEQNILRFTSVTSSNSPLNWNCSTTSETNRRIPSQYPAGQEVALSPADPPLIWGSAVVAHPTNGETLIYGVRKDPCDPEADPEDPEACPYFGNAKIAKVSTRSHLFSYSTGSEIYDTLWYFYYVKGTDFRDATHTGSAYYCQTGPCWIRVKPTAVAGANNQEKEDAITRRNALRTVAWEVPTEFSVDYITDTVDGITASRWIMVHGDAANLLNANGTEYTPPPNPPPWVVKTTWNNLRKLVMRSTTNSTRFPHLPHGDRHKNSSGTVLGSTHNTDWIKDADPKVVAGYNAYRSVHAVRGQGRIRSSGYMYVSYHVWDHYVHSQTGQPCVPSDSEDYCKDTVVPWLYYTAADAANGASYRISPFRFTAIPLDTVHPWCGSNCPPEPPPQ